jgi:hypothetical protein
MDNLDGSVQSENKPSVFVKSDYQEQKTYSSVYLASQGSYYTDLGLYQSFEAQVGGVVADGYPSTRPQ